MSRRSRAWFWLAAGLLPSCGPQRPVETQGRPVTVVKTGKVPPAECKSGDVMLGERACSMRSNSGMYQRGCVDGAWQETEICACAGTVKFASAALERKISESLHLTAPFSAERAAAVRELKVNGAGIESLEGLECFHALEELHAGRNRLTDLAPLAGLDRLEILKVYDNDIADLAPLARLKSLTDLSLAQNEVRDIKVLVSLPNLEEISLYDNYVVDLAPLREHQRLKILSLGQNCVSDLGPVANLSRLELLNASFNLLRDASPVRGLRGLQHLILAGNNVTNLEPIGELTNLKTLFVDSNGLRDVSALTKLTAFKLVVIQRNPIDCDAQAGNIALLEQHAQASGGELSHDCTPKRRRAIRLGLDKPFEVRFETDAGEQRIKLPQTHDKNRCDTVRK